MRAILAIKLTKFFSLPSEALCIGGLLSPHRDVVRRFLETKRVSFCSPADLLIGKRVMECLWGALFVIITTSAFITLIEQTILTLALYHTILILSRLAQNRSLGICILGSLPRLGGETTS